MAVETRNLCSKKIQTKLLEGYVCIAPPIRLDLMQSFSNLLTASPSSWNDADSTASTLLVSQCPPVDLDSYLNLAAKSCVAVAVLPGLKAAVGSMAKDWATGGVTAGAPPGLPKRLLNASVRAICSCRFSTCVKRRNDCTAHASHRDMRPATDAIQLTVVTVIMELFKPKRNIGVVALESLG